MPYPNRALALALAYLTATTNPSCLEPLPSRGRSVSSLPYRTSVLDSLSPLRVAPYAFGHSSVIDHLLEARSPAFKGLLLILLIFFSFWQRFTLCPPRHF